MIGILRYRRSLSSGIPSPIITSWSEGSKMTGLDGEISHVELIQEREPYEYWAVGKTRISSPNDPKVALSYSNNGFDWTQYEGNPININADKYNSPTFFKKIAGTYYLFYFGPDGQTESIGIASSSDLTSYTDLGYFIGPGLTYDPGHEGVAPRGELHFIDGEYYLTVENFTIQTSEYIFLDLWRTVNYAANGFQNWERIGKILDKGGSGEWDETAVYQSKIINYNGLFVMYYAGQNSSGKRQIGIATSTNIAGPYTKHPNNPILTSSIDLIGSPVPYYDYNLKKWRMYYRKHNGSTWEGWEAEIS